MKLQKKLTMLGVALVTTGMLAVSNLPTVSAQAEIFNVAEMKKNVEGRKDLLLLYEYAFLYKNQTNPDAILEYQNRTVTVQDKLKEVPLSKYEKALGYNAEKLKEYRNKAIENLEKNKPRGIWKQTEEGWHYVIWYGNGGVAAEGWIQDGGNWYYLGTNGVMVTGWAQDNGKWYYLQPSGAMATGWIQDNGKWYFLDSSGAMKTGWYEVNGKWYYSYGSGELAVNTTIDGYTVNGNGEWV